MMARDDEFYWSARRRAIAIEDLTRGTDQHLSAASAAKYLSNGISVDQRDRSIATLQAEILTLHRSNQVHQESVSRLTGQYKLGAIRQSFYENQCNAKLKIEVDQLAKIKRVATAGLIIDHRDDVEYKKALDEYKKMYRENTIGMLAAALTEQIADLDRGIHIDLSDSGMEKIINMVTSDAELINARLAA